MFLSKTFYPLNSFGSTQEDRKSSRHDLKIVEWDVKHQNKTNFTSSSCICKQSRFYCFHFAINGISVYELGDNCIQNFHLGRYIIRSEI